MERNHNHTIIDEEIIGRKMKLYPAYKHRVLKEVVHRIDEYLFRSAMNYDGCGGCLVEGDDLVNDVIEIVAPGLLKREDGFGLESRDHWKSDQEKHAAANPDELLCFMEVRINVGFVLGFILAARVLDGRSLDSFGDWQELLADKVSHAFNCEICEKSPRVAGKLLTVKPSGNKRKGANHGNQ